MKYEKEILKARILNELVNSSHPLTASAVALKIDCTSQKACALLHQLCYENKVEQIDIKKRNSWRKAYKVLKNLSVDWEVIPESVIEFEVEKPMSYKEKIFKIIYEILLDYFN